VRRRERQIALTAARQGPGDHASMHLHIVSPDDRATGAGVECVRRSVAIYFAALKLKRLFFSEPNAFNIAPNRTL
jgi:hypothetical protein